MKTFIIFALTIALFSASSCTVVAIRNGNGRPAGVHRVPAGKKVVIYKQAPPGQTKAKNKGRSPMK